MHPHISSVGAECFARQLMRCCGLTSLNLNDQRVRDRGAAYLFKSMIPSRLRVLNLGRNELTDKCCVSLFEALSSNPNLEKLTLSNNVISDQVCGGYNTHGLYLPLTWQSAISTNTNQHITPPPPVDRGAR